MSSTQSHILIVDDDTLIRSILSRQLGKEGHRCIGAGNASEALEKIREGQVDLIILDIMMPGKSGRELLPEIRNLHPDIAVIMSTAVTDINVVIECMREGARDYLSKPFDLENVSRRVKWVLHNQRVEKELKHYQQQLKASLSEQTREVRKIFIGAIESLVTALEANDKYTAGHSRRVMEISMAIGKELRMESNDLENLCWGALLHDIGKIALDPQIRNKPGQLTEEEYAHIMDHVNIGPEIVQSIANEQVVEMIKHHHYRYDGTGFQQELSGDDIPLGARILAVADTYDAMTSDRPYRASLSPHAAVSEIEHCSGNQFDPLVVEAFLLLNLAGDRLPTP